LEGGLFTRRASVLSPFGRGIIYKEGISIVPLWKGDYLQGGHQYCPPCKGGLFTRRASVLSPL